MTAPERRPLTLRRLRRRWIVVAGGLILAALAILALDRPSWIEGYRVAGARSLIVTTVEGPGAWTRVASVDETPTTITITVKSILFRPGPGSDEGVLVESTVSLRDPIGTRAVIDGSTGLPVALRP